MLNDQTTPRLRAVVPAQAGNQRHSSQAAGWPFLETSPLTGSVFPPPRE